MHAVAHKTDLSPVRGLRPWTRFLQSFGKAGALKLDIESLPDHLKRDLGIIGGRETPPRDPLRD